LGRGFWAKNPKPSGCGSVSGVPSQTATGADGVGCWAEVGEVVIVVGHFAGTREAGEGVGS
jgi:hypothetical protein